MIHQMHDVQTIGCCLPSVRLLVRGLEYGTYTWVWQHYGLLPSLEDSLTTAVILVILIDFGYYWFHRASHGKSHIDRLWN